MKEGEHQRDRVVSKTRLKLGCLQGVHAAKQDRTWLWRILLQSCWETCMLDYLSEVPVHQCMKHWENTEELEICVWLQGHDLIAITVLW